MTCFRRIAIPNIGSMEWFHPRMGSFATLLIERMVLDGRAANYRARNRHTIIKNHPHRAQLSRISISMRTNTHRLEKSNFLPGHSGDCRIHVSMHSLSNTIFFFEKEKWRECRKIQQSMHKGEYTFYPHIFNRFSIPNRHNLFQRKRIRCGKKKKKGSIEWISNTKKHKKIELHTRETSVRKEAELHRRDYLDKWDRLLHLPPEFVCAPSYGQAKQTRRERSTTTNTWPCAESS